MLPSAQYPIVDLPHGPSAVPHADDVEQHAADSVDQLLGGPGGPTSERGADSAVPHARAIIDDHGRMMVLMTHNTDIGDSFEREGDSRAYFLQFPSTDTRWASTRCCMR